MQYSPNHKLFSNAPRWPNIPPWWLLPSPQVAAILGATAQTLNRWRTLRTGPKATSTALYRPTRGGPDFYCFAEVRKWACARQGLSYSLRDQVIDFLTDFFPDWHATQFPMDEQVKHFDNRFRSDRALVRRGKEPENIKTSLILEWDNYFSKQPRLVSKTTQNYVFSPLDLVAS